MQMIMDALSPEKLDLMREVILREREPMQDDPTARAEAVDAACRRNADAAAEKADRLAFANRKERRLAKALAR